MEKINVAELLKDCPSGMELDCAIWDNCTFEGIEDVGYINILVKTPNGLVKLSKEGYLYHNHSGSKCVIFPKGKTTWEGFHRPFKDGDIVATNGGTWIGITTGGVKEELIPIYCVIKSNGTFEAYLGTKMEWCFSRLATKAEKAKLFDAIKANGYNWNMETKTLEKVIEPKFKLGDMIRQKNQHEVCLISEVCDNHYLLDEKDIALPFFAQDDWELAPGKFDLSTLVPFESKVLVRDHEEATWRPAIWGFYDEREDITYPYNIVGGVGYARCIPYESNEHLLNTTDKCEDFYITWED